MGPGELFGHASMLSGLPAGFEARAAEDTLCYVIEAEVAAGRVSRACRGCATWRSRCSRPLGLTVEQFKELYQPLDTRKKQIEADIPRVEAEVDMLSVDRLSKEQIMADARDLHSRWPLMNHDERRKIIELLVKTIVIGNGEITLNLCYLPNFEQMTNGQRIL